MNSQAAAGDAGRDAREYWRDRLTSLLGWGTAFALLVCGWLVQYGPEIELLRPKDAVMGAKAEAEYAVAWKRAMFLITLAPVWLGAWAAACLTIHKRFLARSDDATVLPFKLVRFYVVLLSLGLYAIIWAVALT